MKHDNAVDSDCLVVYPSRIKLGLILVGSLVFVALGVHIARVDEERGIDFWKVVVVSYLGVPFFAYCALFSAWRLLVRRPALVIDSSGITDAASAVGVGHVAWDEVDRLVLYNFRGQAMLGIFPRDMDSVLRTPAAPCPARGAPEPRHRLRSDQPSTDRAGHAASRPRTPDPDALRGTLRAVSRG